MVIANGLLGWKRRTFVRPGARHWCPVVVFRNKAVELFVMPAIQFPFPVQMASCQVEPTGSVQVACGDPSGGLDSDVDG